MIYFVCFDEVDNGFDSESLVRFMQSFPAFIRFSSVAWMIATHKDVREICRRLASFTCGGCDVIVTEVGAVATYERKECGVFNWTQDCKRMKY